MTPPKQNTWQSPNGKYTIYTLLFPNETVPSVKIKVQGRKSLINFNTLKSYRNGKVPKYVFKKAEMMRWELTRKVEV